MSVGRRRRKRFEGHGERLPCGRMLATAAAIFSVLLIVTGAAKIVRPHDLTKALVDLGLPRVPAAGLMVGIVEVAIGLGALLFSPALIAQGVLYAAFAVWVLVALRGDVPIASCGCLGRDDTPPTIAHIVLNVLGAVLSFGAVSGDGLVIESALEGIAQVVVIGVGVFLSYLVLNQAVRLVAVRS